MKKKKSVIIVVLSVILLGILATVLYFVLNDKNKLTVVERNWVNENISTIQNINVLNNVNVIGKNGKGIYYDFLEDFSKHYGITINPITFNVGEEPSGITFGVKRSVSKDDIIVYTDHYVLVSNNKEVIALEDDLDGKTIGILNKDYDYVASYIKKETDITFLQYENRDELLNNMGSTVSYMVVPLMEYLDTILSKDYHIIYHFSDIKLYFTFSSNDSVLASVIKKYYNTWTSSYNKSYNSSLFNVFCSSMNISDTDIDAMQSVVYNYGFVNSSPYEVIMGGKYGGIVAVYLSSFSEFSDVEFNFVKYKNYERFVNAINKKDIDLYFNFYNFKDNFNQTGGITIEYAVASRRDNSDVIRSINSLVSKDVYVLEGSKIYDYIKSINGINVKTFKSTKELFKLNKKDVFIVLDRKSFDYYSLNELDNYSLKYSDFISNEYTFKVRDNNALYKLLDKYIEVMDESDFILKGLDNHYETLKSGSFITRIAEYIILGVVILVVLVFIILKKSKKISIARKIKKDDKMKFIDQLTSLKNRNFLNENISVWNNNTIYPQTIIVIDLNKLQDINDSYGYNEGDRQIKAMANILVRTQLDNSEIMRTDGNEFVIYLVGYTQKQVSNYIHKLTKEIKKLPYEFGAEFGYSMILDDIMTIEDALNEAVEDMKKQKEIKSNEKTK